MHTQCIWEHCNESNNTVKPMSVIILYSASIIIIIINSDYTWYRLPMKYMQYHGSRDNRCPRHQVSKASGVQGIRCPSHQVSKPSGVQGISNHIEVAIPVAYRV